MHSKARTHTIWNRGVLFLVEDITADWEMAMANKECITT